MLSVVLVLSASSPAWGAPIHNPAGVSPFLEMPDLVISFKKDGGINVMGIPLSWISRIPGVGDISLEPETVARFTNSNVQHIDLDYHSSGMVLLVNGQPILDFHYDDHDQLGRLVNGLSIFMGEQGGTMLSVAPQIVSIMKTLGVEIIAKFPVSAGESSIPVASDDSYTRLTRATIIQFEYGARVAGVESFVLHAAPDGSLTSGNFAIKLLQAVISPDVELKLPVETVQGVSAAEIREVKVKTRHYGLALELNGQDDPLMICYLNNLLALADEAERWRNLAPNVSEERVDLVRRVVQDVLLATNVDITLHFPTLPRQDVE